MIRAIFDVEAVYGSPIESIFYPFVRSIRVMMNSISVLENCKRARFL